MSKTVDPEDPRWPNLKLWVEAEIERRVAKGLPETMEVPPVTDHRSTRERDATDQTSDQLLLFEWQGEQEHGAA